MINRIFLIVCVALVSFTGCGSDDTSDNENDMVIPVIPNNSDVRIQLSSGSGGTRAALDSDDGTNTFEANDLGIFCLANGFVENTKFDKTITWDPLHQHAKYYRLLDNVKADAVKKTKTEDGTAYTDIEFYADNGTEKEIKYYPLSNWLTYQFYGYYPRTTDITGDAYNVYADIPITGKEDVIHGYTDNTAPNAYSAKYFRETANINTSAKMAFEHKLIQVQFHCIAGMKGGVVDEKTKDLIIKKVEVCDVPEKVRLVVASTDKEANGTLSITGTTDAKYTVCGDNDGEFVPVLVSETKQELGQGIMLPPLNTDGANGLKQQYRVRITLAQATGGDEKMLDVFPDAVLTSEEGKFTKAGTLYNVVLTIYSPEDIRLNATLAPWITDDKEYDVQY